MGANSAEFAEELEPGTELGGRYRVLSRLGRGGMGVVYLGEQLRLQRKVAIKVLAAEWSGNEVVRRRFETEAKATSRTPHSNVVMVLDADELPDGRLYLVMELLEGKELFDVVHHAGRLPAKRALGLIRDVANGVRAAHRQGIIHRDLKLENVIICDTPEGEVAKVLDFGVAAQVTLPEADGRRLTRPGVSIGTPEYMAPEQVDGVEPSPSFDIYALGVMLYEMLTGKLPIDDDNRMRLMARKCEMRAPSLRHFLPDAPDDLCDFVAACLEISPTKRPLDCDDFIARLDALELDSGALAVPATSPHDLGAADSRTSTSLAAPHPSTVRQAATQPLVTPPEVARKRTSAPLVALALVVLVGVGIAGFYFGRGPQELAVSSGSGEASGGQNVEAPVDEVPSNEGTEAEPDPPPEPAQGHADPVPDSGPERVDPKTEPDEGAKPLPSPSAPSPETAPTKNLPAKSKPSLSDAACKEHRDAARSARKQHDWKGVLQHAKLRACWPSASERQGLRTQALMELGRYDECAKVGKGAHDPEVTRWVKVCELRGSG